MKAVESSRSRIGDTEHLNSTASEGETLEAFLVLSHFAQCMLCLIYSLKWLPWQVLQKTRCKWDQVMKSRRGKWGDRRGSNPRQPEPQSGALPTELRPPTV